MKRSYIFLALLGVSFSFIGINRAASTSAVAAAEHFGVSIKSPVFLFSEVVEVGIIGSLVIARLVENGKKTVILSLPDGQPAGQEGISGAQ
tara:strand:- start:1885 stop:2157 length:273 start_codon:yes stop_codon:yes gene_type:complete